jgi:hypothetical protein
MRLLRTRPEERPLSDVPRMIRLTAALALAAHIGWQAALPPPQAAAAALATPAPLWIYRLASLGEPAALGQAMMLRLQAFDNQPGVSVPFRALDYGTVIQWLTVALELDPAGQYPLMLATHVYAPGADERRQRMMFEFVHRSFLEDPERRWRWLAHAAILARHRLRDMELALRYADDIARHAGGAHGWARQMRIFMLADMGEVEAASVLLGGLLESGELTDPAEIRFLTGRLEELKNAETSTVAPKFRQPGEAQ